MSYDDFPAPEGDEKRRKEIEYFLNTNRDDYFRNEPMQKEYYDILTRQEAGKGEPSTSGHASVPSEESGANWSLFGSVQSQLPGWAQGYLEKTPQGVGPTELLNTTARESYRERAINRLPVGSIVAHEAAAGGLDPRAMKIFAHIESSGNPRKSPTGKFKGLFQLSDEEFKKYEPSGNILDPTDNTRAAVKLFKDRIGEFKRSHNGREPTITELYLIHQQGAGGLAAHQQNPARPAWQSMRYTGEGRDIAAGQGSVAADKWARDAVWRNLTPEEKKKFPGGVDMVTSGDLMEFWKRQIEGSGW